MGYCREMVYSFAALVFAAGRGVMTTPGVELTEEKDYSCYVLQSRAMLR